MGREDETEAVIGRKLAAELDQMKGLAMKVGQILSYFDGTLPAQAQEALQSLQRGANSAKLCKNKIFPQRGTDLPPPLIFLKIDLNGGVR